MLGHSWTGGSGKNLQNQRFAWWTNGFDGRVCSTFTESIWRTIFHMIVEEKMYSRVVENPTPGGLVDPTSQAVNPINDRLPPQNLTLVAKAKGAAEIVPKGPRYKSPPTKPETDTRVTPGENAEACPL